MAGFVAKNRLYPRPNARHGLWALFLLPVSIIIPVIKYPIILTPTYKLVAITTLSLLFSSLIILRNFLRDEHLKALNIWTTIATIVTTALFRICLFKSWTFSVLSGIFSTVLFIPTFLFILRRCKDNFTLGEAGIVTQAIIIFLYSTFLNIQNGVQKNWKFRTNMQISTIIIQMGLLGLMVIAYCAYKFQIKGPVKFYSTSLILLMLITFLPLHVFLGQSPVLWILSQMFYDSSMLKLITFWSFCSGIAVLAISNQIFYAQKASSAKRKVFHILSIVVFVPGLLYRCSFLYLASGVVLGVFFALEILRILCMPPLGLHLQNGYVVFSDEKDTGLFALTPIYLLAGCSIPIWVHPSPCDVTDSAMFNILPLLSGLLTVGVGDTSASFVGSHFGRLHWPGSKKTIEGTMACIFSQLAFVYLLAYFDCIPQLNQSQYVKTCFAIFVTSIVEARTTQIDNLVLPFLMYIITV